MIVSKTKLGVFSGSMFSIFLEVKRNHRIRLGKVLGKVSQIERGEGTFFG